MNIYTATDGEKDDLRNSNLASKLNQMDQDGTNNRNYGPNNGRKRFENQTKTSFASEEPSDFIDFITCSIIVKESQ